MKDTALKFSQNLPAAGADNATDSIYIGGAGVNRYIKAKINVDALPSLADDKSATFTLQKSDDNVTFSDLSLDGVSTYTLELVGAGGAGVTAQEAAVLVPDGVKYLRLIAEVEALGGNNTAKEYHLQLDILAL
jgi:hypothetical protein